MRLRLILFRFSQGKGHLGVKHQALNGVTVCLLSQNPAIAHLDLLVAFERIVRPLRPAALQFFGRARREIGATPIKRFQSLLALVHPALLEPTFDQMQMEPALFRVLLDQFGQNLRTHFQFAAVQTGPRQVIAALRHRPRHIRSRISLERRDVTQVHKLL